MCAHSGLCDCYLKTINNLFCSSPWVRACISYSTSSVEALMPNFKWNSVQFPYVSPGRFHLVRVCLSETVFDSSFPPSQSTPSSSQPNTVPLPLHFRSQIKSKWWTENYVDTFFPWWHGEMFKSSPSRYWIWRMNYAQLKSRGKFLVQGTHLRVTPDGCPVHYEGQPREFHISLLLGGSQEGGTQAESISVVRRFFRGKLTHSSECLLWDRISSFPAQVDGQFLEFLPLSW